MNCITLLSDFGLQDASVANVKGVLMQYTSLPVVDISHLIEPYHLQQAAYMLTASYKNFPEKSCHLLLFDIFSEKQPRLLLCEKDGHYFLAPDNGILSLAFDAELKHVWHCLELKDKQHFKDWLHKAGSVIKDLQTKSPSEMQLPPAQLKNAPLHWRPLVNGSTVECHVVHIDRFENVVINITRHEFDTIGKGRPFRIQFMRNEELTEVSNHYNNVKESEKLCRFNAAGYLEIAINRGKAASLFGLRLFNDQHLMYNTIKIFFE